MTFRDSFRTAMVVEESMYKNKSIRHMKWTNKIWMKYKMWQKKGNWKRLESKFEKKLKNKSPHEKGGKSPNKKVGEIPNRKGIQKSKYKMKVNEWK